MTPATLTLTPSLAALGVGLLGLASLTVWWLLRKRQTRVWLPTTRIMRLEPRVLPRLVFRPPPLLAFLCFLAAACAIFGFAFRPRTQVFTPFEPNQTRMHIFCDMSPSVSAQVTIDEYAARVATLVDTLKARGRVSLSTSALPGVVRPASGAEAAQIIKAGGFHRGGLRLGTAVKQLLKDTVEADRLFIVSDRDQHSWTGFNWRYLLDEMDIVFYDLSAEGQPKTNLFINDAWFLSSPSSQTMDWDVEIARRGGDGPVQGKLTATVMGRELGVFPWQLPAGKQRVNVRATWPATAVGDVDIQTVHDVPLVFHLEPEGNDALPADNEFRTELKGLKQDVLIVSESGGERALEDPAQELEVALTIQGFRLKRYDYLGEGDASTADFPFIVLLGGAEGNAASFCPKSLETARLAKRSSGREAKALRGSALPKVWLAPARLNANYQALCECYAKLLFTTNAAAPPPAFCKDIETRAQWAALLPSLGAKQIGGQVDDAAKALAFSHRDQASGLEVLAFTVPLMPSIVTGINHAEMPILVKELLTWQGLIEAQGIHVASWPRVDDVAALTTNGDAKDPDVLARIRASNVPLGESMLAETDEASLPPRWSAGAELDGKQLPAKKDREDPLPWLQLAAAVCILAMAAEAGATLGVRLYRFVRRRPQVAALFIVMMFSGKAFGKVELALLGAHGSTPSFGMLAREVSHRTSIEIEAKPNLYSQASIDAYSEPWLFVEDLSTVMGKNGKLLPELAVWLRRGGFLIIEAPWHVQQLEGLVSGLQTGPAGTTGDVGWQPLPPDHEIMRSFYLLDALPSCNGEIWRGYQFDGRLAILAVPYGFLQSIKDHGSPAPCANPADQERSVRVFVNLIMVALATDYKRDQIHLPEILKRLR